LLSRSKSPIPPLAKEGEGEWVQAFSVSCQDVTIIRGGNTVLEDGWHETKVRVRYKDTDRMGVVYYATTSLFLKSAGELMRSSVPLLEA